MLRRTVLSFASKASGGSSTYQARPPTKKPKQFHIYLNQGVSKREMIKEQRNRYTVFYERQPLYVAGKHTSINPKTLTVTPTVDGIVSRRDSKINPNLRRWLDVDPDIQKIARSRAVRNELRIQNELSSLTKVNPFYKSELNDVADPDWRIKIQQEAPLTKRFADVNCYTRGITTSLKPKRRFTYV